MTNPTPNDMPDNTDASLPDTTLLDADLRELFAAAQPAADFEDRLVTAVRRHRRLLLPMPRFPLAVQRAAIAAAAVLAVGVTGYVGNRVLLEMHPLSTASVGSVPGSSFNGKIAKGDVMNISVDDQTGAAREITKQTRVDDNGNISLPQLGLVKAEGLTEDELQSLIADEYRDRQIIKHPEVTITVAESRNRSQQNSVKTDKDMLVQGLAKATQGQNVLYGDGHTEWMNNPFVGSQHDNVYTGGKTEIASNQQFGLVGTSTKGIGPSPYDNLDSIVLPGASQGEVTTRAPAAVAAPVTIAPSPTGGRGGQGGDVTRANNSTNHRDETINTTSDRLNAVGVETRNQVGSGGYNSAGNGHPNAGKTGTGIVTGQVGGLDYFRGSVGLRENLAGENPASYGPAPQATPVPKANYFASAEGQERGQTPLSALAPTSDARDVAQESVAQDQVPPFPPRIVSGTLQLPAVDLNKYKEHSAAAKDNTVRVDSDGNPITGADKDRIADVGNAAVPGSIAANPADETQLAPRASTHDKETEKALIGLVREARQSVDDGKYQEALGAIDKIQRLDPTNAYAGGVRPFVEDRAANRPFRGVPDASVSGLIVSQEKPGVGGQQVALATPAPVAPNTPNSNEAQAPAPKPVAAPPPAVDDRKIIRTGSMEFDVDRFDTAQMQITKIVGELGGFVGATDSQKLPNGKVRGSISVRVAPERLDVLVLSLRALGDLKSQQITAADITKEYTDIQSELAADRAMQDRLLELIHDGKGSVKDLLAAENELGTWRTKIEKAEGMIRYYNGQVALSTLSITMTERDIQTPATAVETETADVGIEAEDVEKARNSAMKAIDDVKGRIVEAELKRFDAGQLAARLVADVPPESAGAVIDQLKLLGKVARLEIHRQETDSNGKGTEVPAGAAPLHTERKPTRLLISIYNLANVAPRRTTNVSLAAADVEAAYTALVNATKSSGGRVVTSTLDRGDPVKATGSLVLEFPPDKFDGALATLHAQGEVLNLNLTENPDTQNSTEAKTGLTVKLVSLAIIPPRRTTNVSLAATDVNAAYAAMVNITKSSGGRVVNSTLDQGEPAKATGTLILELPPEKLEAAIATLHAQGEVLNLNLAESRDTQNSTDAKAGLTVRLVSLAAVAPRETVQQTLAAVDVPAAYQAILTAASIAHARVQSASLNEQDRQNITGEIDVEVPRASAAGFDNTLNAAGGTISRTSARAAEAEGSVDSKVLVKLTITPADRVPPRETTKLLMEVGDVDKSAANAQAAAIGAGGRVLVSKLSKDQGQGVAWVGIDFPLSKSAEVLAQVRREGTVRGIDASRDAQAPSGPMAHAVIEVEFRTTEAIIADQTGPWASVRQGLATSIHGLLLSLQWIVVGLCLIGPWAGIGWIGWKVFKRRKRVATQ
jgi:hypothetical protein